MEDELGQLVAKLIELSTSTEGGARRLPPERQLNEALGISRGRLREQLATLEYLGLLRRRQGHGTYIDVPDASLFRTSFNVMHQLGFMTTDQFVRAREMIEESIAAEATSAVTESDFIEMRAIVKRMVAHTMAGESEEAMDADFEFHNYLYELVDNPVFNMMQEGLSTVLRENIRSRRALALDIEGNLGSEPMNTDTVHYAIVDALTTRDPDLARAAMRQHFVDFSALALHSRAADSRGR